MDPFLISQNQRAGARRRGEVYVSFSLSKRVLHEASFPGSPLTVGVPVTLSEESPHSHHMRFKTVQGPRIDRKIGGSMRTKNNSCQY